MKTLFFVLLSISAFAQEPLRVRLEVVGMCFDDWNIQTQAYDDNDYEPVRGWMSVDEARIEVHVEDSYLGDFSMKFWVDGVQKDGREGYRLQCTDSYLKKYVIVNTIFKNSDETQWCVFDQYQQDPAQKTRLCFIAKFH